MKADGGQVRSDAGGSYMKAEGGFSLVSPCGGRGAAVGNQGRDSDLGVWFNMPEPLHLIP